MFRQHTLKLNPAWREPLRSGVKKAEVRPNDRDYRVGDYLVFVDAETGCPTGLQCRITHLLRHEEFPEGIQPGYVVLSLQVVSFSTHLTPLKEVA